MRENFVEQNSLVQTSAREKEKNIYVRTRIIVPLIVVLMLICVVTIILVVGVHSVRPTETAELNKDVEQKEEKISAAATTVQAGETYTVPKDGIYKIELHGGHGEDNGNYKGGKGSKVTGYVRLNSGDILTTESYSGGKGSTRQYFNGSSYVDVGFTVGAGGNGVGVYLHSSLVGYASGGPGYGMIR